MTGLLTIVSIVVLFGIVIAICMWNGILANVNSRSRSLYAIARPSVCLASVVGNARAPYSGGSNVWAIFLRH